MKLRSLAVLALCLLPACSGAADPKTLADEGLKALNSGQYQDAATSFEKALAQLGSDTSNPQWKRAKLGLFQAQTRIDAIKAKDAFLEFARSNPSIVNDEDYSQVAGRLGEAGKFEEAIEILTVAKAAYPESKHIDALGKSLVSQAKSSGAADALDALKGLGYL